MGDAIKSGNTDQTSRYTSALSALGPEALPEIRLRLQKPDLSPEVFSAYAAALVEAGGEQALPDLRAIWDSPRVHDGGLPLKHPLVIALVKRRTPEAGKTLLVFWLEETDPATQQLLSQALKTNPQVNGPLITAAWQQNKDEASSKRLQALSFEMAAQSGQQQESRELMALKVETPEALEAYRRVLERPGNMNKGFALERLETRGDGEALEALLAYAKANDSDSGLRYQALTSYCRKADSGQAFQVVSWFTEASPAVRYDILNAMGRSENPVFLGFVTDLAAQAEDASVKTRAHRVRDLLVMAENRRKRKVGLKP